MPKLQLPLSPESRLVRWSNAISAYYGYPLWLVGSQITGKANPRDVDIVCAIPEREFTLRYGDVNEWRQQGGTGIYTTVRWNWADDCHKRSIDGMDATGLAIDFKVQPANQWIAHGRTHDKYPPVRLDTRPDGRIFTIADLKESA